nr:hypothetical protein [Tanacetum cinerariifolium]
MICETLMFGSMGLDQLEQIATNDTRQTAAASLSWSFLGLCGSGSLDASKCRSQLGLQLSEELSHIVHPQNVPQTYPSSATVVSSSVTLSLTPSMMVGAISIILSTISSYVSVILYPACSTLHLLMSDSVGPGCLAAAVELSNLESRSRSSKASPFLRQHINLGNIGPTGNRSRLVVSGDGKGNGKDGTSSGGEGKAACLAMHAFIDADMGGSGLTVFCALRRHVWERGILIGDPGACVVSSDSSASVSPTRRTRSTIGTVEESAGAGCSSSSSSSSSKGYSSRSSSSVSSSSSSSEGSSSPSPPSAG